MKTYIPPRRISQAFIAVGITSIIIFIANFLFTRQETVIRKSSFNVGQIASQTIVAPYNFYIYEDPEILKDKQEKAEERVLPKYQFSNDVTFDIQTKINDLFSALDRTYIGDTVSTVQIQRINLQGVLFNESELVLLENKEKREDLYEFLLIQTKNVLNQGILATEPSKESITLINGNSDKEIPIKELFTKATAITYILNQRSPEFKSVEWTTLIEKILNVVIQPNVLYDAEATELAKRRAREGVQKILGEVLKNELIVQEHQKITSEMLLKLDALEQAEQMRMMEERSGEKILASIAQFVYIFLILSLFIILSYFLYPEFLNVFSFFRTFMIFTAGIALLLILAKNVTSLSVYILPFGMPIILLAFLINIPAAIIFATVNYFLMLAIIDWKVVPATILILSGISAVLPLGNPRSRRDFYNSAFYMLLFFVALVFIFGALNHVKILTILNDIKWGVFNVGISLVGSMALLAPIEQRLPVITNIHLLELGDFSNPLLKTLSEVASGTYHHSIIVGNLAEAGAKAIGANPILARVGSYYHDIGKTKDPEYYIENTTKEESIHNQMTATQSAQIVKRHVEEGVKLAKEHHIPKPIIDIIQQHHGTSLISFFYNQAMQDNEEIDEKDFYYDGPKPQTKEAAIVMIADIIESTTKSLEEPTVDEIENIVHKTLKRLLENEQLAECDISLKELKTLQENMMPILLGIYQKRIAYPE